MCGVDIVRCTGRAGWKIKNGFIWMPCSGSYRAHISIRLSRAKLYNNSIGPDSTIKLHRGSWNINNGKILRGLIEGGGGKGCGRGVVFLICIYYKAGTSMLKERGRLVGGGQRDLIRLLTVSKFYCHSPDKISIFIMRPN
jgi:hypothetical protein